MIRGRQGPVVADAAGEQEGNGNGETGCGRDFHLLRLTQPTTKAVVIMTNKVAMMIRYFISIFPVWVDSPLASCRFNRQKVVPVGGIEPPTKGL
jgi:hypothetical protein